MSPILDKSETMEFFFLFLSSLMRNNLFAVALDFRSGESNVLTSVGYICRIFFVLGCIYRVHSSYRLEGKKIQAV